ncbi:unnamed protein product, partial [Mesorhabditis belari]|uniref:lipoyl(octanoyl) transferase n=1 Tax=Mesorhabditis belari TaxID=2138241 RepID=A0AAF3FFF3_9BILA
MLQLSSLIAGPSKRFLSDSVRKTFVCANGVVASWHPQTKVPYEHTKPINLSRVEESTTPLKSAVSKRHPRVPDNSELKEIFYTPKNEWYTRTREARLFSRVADSKTEPTSKNYLLCLEHTPVYTVGIRSNVYNSKEEERLKQLGADFHRTSRGGLITFHGPGQLVIYPILDLRRFSPRRFGVRQYVDTLEQAVIDCTVGDFHISNVGRSDKNTGVWVGANKKICAMGIAVKNGITSHGLALNCNNDLKWFSHIVACGIQDVEVTSISKETKRDVDVNTVIPLLAHRLAHVFECQVFE